MECSYVSSSYNVVVGSIGIQSWNKVQVKSSKPGPSRKVHVRSNYRAVPAMCDKKTEPSSKQSEVPSPRKGRVQIEYCVGCKWMLRSAWIAQELLQTFESELSEVALCPSSVSGTFQIHAQDEIIWERQRDGGFPDIKILKQRVRDVISPTLNLGHSDCK
uniref:Selenoprotein W n=1 Tax=Timspurckia oligopyrenoides TaxID=708627 RepID=A0A7S0ZF64_9RHOD|mmetsp:Transcript_2869/g.5043  ORF Transcript_2869/g.5043 Transcript_2869/m.5043 type:complete len:160 (+) Transcript_2869:375-854(+)